MPFEIFVYLFVQKSIQRQIKAFFFGLALCFSGVATCGRECPSLLIYSALSIRVTLQRETLWRVRGRFLSIGVPLPKAHFGAVFYPLKCGVKRLPLRAEIFAFWQIARCVDCIAKQVLQHSTSCPAGGCAYLRSRQLMGRNFVPP